MCISPLMKIASKVAPLGALGLAGMAFSKKKKPTAATSSSDTGQPQTVQASGTYSPYGTGG